MFSKLRKPIQYTLIFVDVLLVISIVITELVYIVKLVLFDGQIEIPTVLYIMNIIGFMIVFVFFYMLLFMVYHVWFYVLWFLYAIFKIHGLKQKMLRIPIPGVDNNENTEEIFYTGFLFSVVTSIFAAPFVWNIILYQSMSPAVITIFIVYAINILVLLIELATAFVEDCIMSFRKGKHSEEEYQNLLKNGFRSFRQRKQVYQLGFKTIDSYNEAKKLGIKMGDAYRIIKKYEVKNREDLETMLHEKGFSSIDNMMAINGLGFSSLKDYEEAINLGFKNGNEMKLGFKSAEEMRKAQQLGFSNLKEMKEITKLGFKSKFQLEELGYNSAMEWKKMKNAGFKSMADLRDKTGCVNLNQYYKLRKKGFESTEEEGEISRLGFETKEEYDKVIQGGFASTNEMMQTKALGFQTKLEQDKIEQLGFNSKSEYDKAIATGFLDKKTLEKAKQKGFKTKKEFDNALERGFKNSEEIELAENWRASDKKELTEILSNELKNHSDSLLQINSDLINLRSLISSEYEVRRLKEYLASLKTFLEKCNSISKTDPKISIIRTKGVRDKFRRILQETIETIEELEIAVSWSQLRIQYVQKWHEILRQLNLFRAEIPVSLNRISELSNIGLAETESYLKDIVREIPDVGEYLELEQVFIKHYKSSEEMSVLMNEMRNRQIELTTLEETGNLCIYCQTPIPTIEIEGQLVCPQCGKEVFSCSICRKNLYHGEEIVVEEKCGNLFHRRHIVEWIKIKGQCPMCQSRINEENLKTFTP